MWTRTCSACSCTSPARPPARPCRCRSGFPAAIWCGSSPRTSRTCLPSRTAVPSRWPSRARTSGRPTAQPACRWCSATSSAPTTARCARPGWTAAAASSTAPACACACTARKTRRIRCSCLHRTPRHRGRWPPAWTPWTPMRAAGACTALPTTTNWWTAPWRWAASGVATSWPRACRTASSLRAPRPASTARAWLPMHAGSARPCWPSGTVRASRPRPRPCSAMCSCSTWSMTAMGAWSTATPRP
ncbi:MAG: hypothetical protein GAK34_02570 [Delftia tsuruhatensis]|nr:MAG: hypothetical protein GAK34_02570 [Delftia tsuruhatensis]